ncbi:MAG: GerMN domain-containing protein [Armatimonadetes bacterium]|nr:GerMN domain-containing protein [Armatimonadota bacterium]
MAKTKKLKRKTARTPGVLVLMLVAAAVVAGLAAYVKLTPADRVPEALKRVRPSEKVRPKQPSTEAPAPQIVVASPLTQDPDTGWEAVAITVQPGEDPKVAAINAYFRLIVNLDPEAKALAVDVRDGTAHVDLNEAFRAGLGSLEEALFVKGLRATLGQFEDVFQIELFVSGERLQDLGHIDISEPQGVIRRPDWNPKPPEAPPTEPGH